MHLSLRTLAIDAFTVAVLLSSGMAWLRAILHTSNLPSCWVCGAPKVRRSGNHCVADAFLRLMFLVPYRCRGCRARLYGFRTHRPLAHRP
jgi:hypothetical protein